MLLQRICIGLVGLCFFIFLAAGISDRFVVNIISSFMCCIILLEIYRAVGLEGNIILSIIGFFMASSFILIGHFGHVFLFAFVLIYIFSLFVVYVIKYNQIKFEEISKNFFLTVFVSFFVFTAICIRYMPNGQFLIWYSAIGAWITDTFAFFSGKAFGKHKMTEISPKKTWEGFVSGVFGSVICLIIYSLCIQWFGGCKVNYYMVLIFSLMCGVVAQFGDICASAIKREFRIKDYGTKLPGHGGLMDRVDSFLFVIPFSFAFFNCFPLIY